MNNQGAVESQHSVQVEVTHNGSTSCITSLEYGLILLRSWEIIHDLFPSDNRCPNPTRNVGMYQQSNVPIRPKVCLAYTSLLQIMHHILCGQRIMLFEFPTVPTCLAMRVARDPLCLSRTHLFIQFSFFLLLLLFITTRWNCFPT